MSEEIRLNFLPAEIPRYIKITRLYQGVPRPLTKLRKAKYADDKTLNTVYINSIIRASLMPNNNIISQLLNRHDTWQGLSKRAPQRSIATGEKSIDSLLHGGWPSASLIELIPRRHGVGELSLLLPTIGEYCRNDHLSVWLTPPFQPYAPTLAAAGIPLQKVLVVQSRSHQEWLWVAEQSIRSNALLLAWTEKKLPSYTEMRKLQLAAADAGHVAFLFSPESVLSASSPAALRLEIDAPDTNNMQLTVHKLRGFPAGETLLVAREKRLGAQCSLSKLPINSLLPSADRRADIVAYNNKAQRLSL